MKKTSSIKSIISRMYYYTLGRILDIASLYRLDLSMYRTISYLEIDPRYQFHIFYDFDDRIGDLYELVPGRTEIVKKRFQSGNYACFTYVDTAKDAIAYARWICKQEFYSDTLGEMLKFKESEVLTLDSYTPPCYRGKGLHRAMNIEMLNWLKQETDFQAVYMVILAFLFHLSKIATALGYKRIYTRINYRKGSFGTNFRVLLGKLKAIRA